MNARERLHRMTAGEPQMLDVGEDRSRRSIAYRHLPPAQTGRRWDPMADRPQVRHGEHKGDGAGRMVQGARSRLHAVRLFGTRPIRRALRGRDNRRLARRGRGGLPARHDGAADSRRFQYGGSYRARNAPQLAEKRSERRRAHQGPRAHRAGLGCDRVDLARTAGPGQGRRHGEGRVVATIAL